MGWVEEKFLDQLARAAKVPKLWDAVRDSIGQAAYEFNCRTDGTGHHLDQTDCMARARLCSRLHKSKDDSTLEVFLDEQDMLLKTATRDEPKGKAICGVRLTTDRSAAEFFLEQDGERQSISIDYACELAIGEFIFTPFPTHFLNPPNI